MMKFVYILLLVGIILNGCTASGGKWRGVCSDPIDIGLIEISPTPDNNPLRGIISVQTGEKTDCYIRYWKEPLAGEDSVVLYSPLSKGKEQHEIMLVNLEPVTKYKFNVVVQNSVCKTYSKTYDLNTPHLPVWIPYVPAPDSIYNLNLDGYIHYHGRKNPGYLFIVNGMGNIVWYMNVPATVKVSKFTRNSTFLTILSHDSLKFASGKMIAEVDLYGQLLYHFDSDEKGIDRVFHHEIDFDENGNIMTLIFDKRVVDLSRAGGSVNDTVKGDAILIMDKHDNVVWQWSVFDVLDPNDYDNILNERNDWLHANALIKDTAGNYLVSFRNPSQIWKVNGKTGKLMWKLGGDDGDISLPDSAKFYGQHNIHFDENGNLVLLDNGNRFVKPGSVEKERDGKGRVMKILKNIKSRLLVFSIDEKNKKAKLVKEVDFPAAYFTKSQGSSSFINDSTVLFCSTNNNMIVISDTEGNVLGRLPVDYPSYRAQYIKELYPTDYVK